MCRGKRKKLMKGFEGPYIKLYMDAGILGFRGFWRGVDLLCVITMYSSMNSL